MDIESMHSLKGKVALVTGGARHLGLDAAEILADAGCNLVITSRSLTNAEATARSLREKYGVEILAKSLDVSVFAEVEQVIRSAIEWKDRLDILVNNAGGSVGDGPAHLFDRDPDDITKMIMVNLVGSLWCCREAGKQMAKQGTGKIINIASIAGMVGRDRRIYDRNGMNGQPVDYAAAKAGLIGMTRDLAGLLSPMGIHVNAISPGGFGPRMHPVGFVRDFSDKTPMGRMGADEKDLKGAIIFLASSASDYVTGHNLVVDGGFTLWH
jgi:NAD(P)-dependent dehydrogenase (short-subunit alcohol dehydrogenase family)